VVIVCACIFLHSLVTIGKSIPDSTSTIEELNMRTNASTFVAMVLYPALGIWSCEMFANADNFFTIHREGQFQWGTIFPVFMWGMSALILVRQSYHAVAVDHAVVVSNEDNSAAIGLHRRYPNALEKLTSLAGRFATTSLWQLLPADLRPAGGAGRFCFQLLEPVVLLFLYIGVRFIIYSAQRIHHQSMCYPTVCLGEFKNIEGMDLDLVKGRFIIWIAFTASCIVVRGFVTSPLFLTLTVPDLQTRKWLMARWPLASVESKRQRVLWSFRGLASAFIPFYYATAQPVPDAVEGAGHYMMWYLYFGVYVSFLMEGVGAIFFALHEAERGCHLKTPFLYFTKESFWASYNSFLQPVGSAVNVLFAILNGEFRTKLNFRELFGPLLNDRGEFRTRLWKKRVSAVAVSQAELDEWIATWKRKRESVGKSIDTLDIVKCDRQTVLPGTGAPAVFEGTVFPTWHERNEMMDHHKQYVSLKPWEVHESEEKFERWHPTYRKEVMSLLAEPYNFSKQREIWVFGYGSLMSPDSPPAGLSERQQKLFLPYWLKKQAGYQRCWNYRHGSVGINAVGLRKVHDDDADDVCGIAYPMDYEFASDLFSKREDGYRLLLLHEDLMEPMHPDYRIPKGCGYIWIVGEPILKCEGPENDACDDYKCKRHWPTEDSPILQSYIDEIIAGCLKYRTVSGKNDGMNFAAAVIRSIRGWERPWFNDRLLAGRPWKFAADYELIDGMLNTCPTSHVGFIKRFRPALSSSPILGRLYESAFNRAFDWSNKFYGSDTICHACSKDGDKPSEEGESTANSVQPAAASSLAAALPPATSAAKTSPAPKKTGNMVLVL